MLDVLLEYPIQHESSQFAIHLGLDRFGVRTVTALRFLAPQTAGNYVDQPQVLLNVGGRSGVAVVYNSRRR